jgi:hypothetical protein
MKYIKTYENIKHSHIWRNEPNVGDFVIAEYDYRDQFANQRNDKDLYEFLKNNIGVIFHRTSFSTSIIYNVQYKYTPKNIRDRFLPMDNQIKINLENLFTLLTFSENKEDLEMIINQDKYNL